MPQSTSSLNEVFARRAIANSNYPSELVTGLNQKTIETFARSGCKRFAEFGVNLGATTLEIAKHLKGDGEIYLFDYQYNVDYVGELLQSNGFSNFHRFGSSSKLLDSYNWPLSQLLEKQSGPLFDYCFLDGAHIWHIDALTFFLVDRLLAVGGYVDFDDYNWSLAISPTLAPHLFPKTSEFYTDEQIKDRQVKRVVDLLVKTSPRYVEIVENKIYQKIANEGESSSFAKLRSIWRRLVS